MEPMLLSNGSSWFQLQITNYQFPGIEKDEWDSNWLIVEGSVRLSDREWHFREPCLTTFEVDDLASWLEGCVQGKDVKTCCAFTEPNIYFDLVDAQHIRVGFANECAPPWASRGTAHQFDVLIGPDVLKAASSLRLQLKKFPLRGSLPHG